MNDNYHQKYLKYKKKFESCVKDRLRKSIYPYQFRDFYFLTIPKGHPDAGMEVTVDYLLKNIVLYFWDRKLITFGWDQGIPGYSGFITFNLKTLDGQKSVGILKNITEKIVGKQNIKVIDNSNLTFKTGEQHKMHIKYTDDFLKNNPNKFLIEIVPNYIAIVFNHDLIPLISKKLKLDIPSHDDALPGLLIKYEPSNKAK